VRSGKAVSGPKRGKARGARRVDQLGQQIGRDASLTGPALQFVCSGRERLGRIVCRGKLGFEAFDADEHSLGIFPNLKRAADAVERAA
jgi:hypothetical protein